MIDLRTLVPLDYHRVLESVKKTRRALVVHAAVEFCGFGAELASTINEELFSILKGPAIRLGADYRADRLFLGDRDQPGAERQRRSPRGVRAAFKSYS